MSGVYGVISAGSSDGPAGLIARISAALMHRPWFVTEASVDTLLGVGLGHVGIGLLNAGPQPRWNDDRTIALVMAGEFTDAGSTDGMVTDEARALALYEQHGELFARHLKGAFVIAVWDSANDRLLIANDRFGLYNTFYTQQDDSMIFAPEMKAILCDPAFPRQIDLTALAEYMRFQHLLGTRTFLEGISLLPPASVLIYDRSRRTLKVKPYWCFGDLPQNTQIGMPEAAEEAGRLLRQATRRLSSDRLRPGVYLSGGLDSRTILGLMERRPVATVTYGVANCRDVVLGARVARAVGSDHHWIDLPNGRWVQESFDLHLELTEGQHSWIHSHGISTLGAARQWMDVNLTGWDGGTIMGHPAMLEESLTHAVDDLALVNRLFYLFNQKYTWPSITEAEERLLYGTTYRRELIGRALESFREEIEPYLPMRPDLRAEFFFLRNHCLRLTHNMVTFQRSHFEVRFPFFDYDLFDFLYSIPAEVRGPRRLYRTVMETEMPSLARIPYDHDELPPTTRPLLRGAHAFGVKVRRNFNRYVRPWFPERSTLYADYENYLHHDLRRWAEAILFDKRTAERGFFDTVFLRSLVDRHHSGLESAMVGKIAPIITYEMMLRRFVD